MFRYRSIALLLISSVTAASAALIESDAPTPPPHLSHNEQVLLNYLLKCASVPALKPVLADLASLPPEQLRAALDSISPARNAAATFFTNQVAFAVGKVALDRFAEKRVLNYLRAQGPKKMLATAELTKQDHLLAMADPLQEIGVATEYGTDPYVASLQPKQPAGKTRKICNQRQKYSAWTTGFGNVLSQDAEHSNPKINDIATGALVGFDYYGMKNAMFSFMTGYLHNDISEDGNSGGGSSNGAVLSFYGTGEFGNGYLEGGLLGEYNHFTMYRNICVPGPAPFCGTAHTFFNDWVMMPHLSGGYDWILDWGIVEPFGSLDLAISFQKGFAEKGASPLNARVRHQTPFILRSQIGLNFYETWEGGKHLWIFQESCSYINQSLFDTHMKSSIVIEPTFVSAPTPFSLWTYDESINLGGVGFELFYKHQPSQFFLSITYRGEFGASYMANDIAGTLGAFF